MSNILLRALGHGRKTDKTYIEDVFSAYTYTGNGATPTITTGIDLDTKEGVLWIKNRTDADSHQIFDTIRGATYVLSSDDAAAASTANADTVTVFGATGFTLGADVLVNENAKNYVGWTFQMANNFFHCSQQVKAAGVDKTVDLSALGTVGMVAVRRADAGGDWFVYHRSCTAGKLLYLNKTDAEAALGYITVSGTTLTLEDGVIADGTYIVYAWAHDTGADGLIQCGTVDSDSPFGFATLGWESQFLMVKGRDKVGDWCIGDTMRKLLNPSASEGTAELYANISGAEASTGGSLAITATQMGTAGFSGPGSYVYLAIRRGPMKLPTIGTQVYNAIARTGTGAAATVTGVGFPPDFSIITQRNGANGKTAWSRLQGATRWLPTNDTAGEYSDAGTLTSFNMDGVSFGTDASYTIVNTNSATYINWFFRRYPGVFDVVCYKGTGDALNVSHNLTVAPELIIVKHRNAADNWAVMPNDPTDYMILNTTAATADDPAWWNDTAPTASVFTVHSDHAVNESAGTYVAYLFATLAGISKVFSVTKVADANLDVDCGFAAGARFIFLKRTDDVGSYYVYDSVRGIIAGNDPYLLLNTTGAEVTNTDYIDPLAAGFTIVDNGLADGNYIGVAIS